MEIEKTLRDIVNPGIPKLDDHRLRGILCRKRPILFNKMDALDHMLFRMLYTHEKLVLAGKNPKKLWSLIEEYYDYPGKIASINGVTEYDISEGITRLVVLVTHSCQLDCSYCSVKKYRSDMDIDTLRRSIDLLITSKKEKVQLQFFGGEPLLRFNLIKEGVRYALSKRSGIEFILTTNGILLSKDVIAYLKEHDFTVEMSLDGDVQTQLKNRQALNGEDYYGRVISNMRYLLDAGVKNHIISVVQPEDIGSLRRNMGALSDLGFDNIQINYALGYLWNRNDADKFFSELDMLDVPIINKTTRREPVVLNAEVTVDCDGDIFLETGICLEKDFMLLKKDFKVGNLSSLHDINMIFPTRSRNLKRLVDVYSQKQGFREIIISNIDMGLRWLTRQ